MKRAPSRGRSFSFRTTRSDQVMQRPGASCLATAVRTLTTGSQAIGRLPADEPLPTVEAGALRASAASLDGIRTMTEELSDPGTLNEIVTPPDGEAAASRSPFADRSTSTLTGPADAVDSIAASPRCIGPSRSLPADTSKCTAPKASAPANTPRVPEARLAICHPFATPHNCSCAIQRGLRDFRSGTAAGRHDKYRVVSGTFP